MSDETAHPGGLTARKWKVWIGLAVAIHIVAAWSTSGFLHPDEHFQILEFAGAKLGTSPAEGLPWEFERRIRPTLMPMVVVTIRRAAQAVGWDDPFAILCALRLVCALGGLAVAFAIARRMMRDIEWSTAQRALVFMSFFLWMVPLQRARFSSENVSGLLMAASLLMVWKALDRSKPAVGLALAGAVAGLAFFARFQIGFCIAGLGIWLVLSQRASIGSVLAAACGFLISGAANVALDSWFYGVATFTPLEYFRFNIIEDGASQFGRDPVWFYVVRVVGAFLPPFSLVVVFGWLLAIFRRPRHPMIWMALPFFLGHSLISHKETRFMVPLLYFVPGLVALGFDAVSQGWRDRISKAMASRYGRAALPAFFLFNNLLLVTVATRPLSRAVTVQRWMNSAGVERLETPPDVNPLESGLPIRFYLPNATRVEFSTVTELEQRAAERGSLCVILNEWRPPQELRSPKLDWKLRARTLPPWAPASLIEDWAPRMRVWNIFECRPVSK